jgi:Rrf2 family protein
MLYLGRNDQREWVSSAEIADALGAPANYLGKTLRQLTRQGLLESSRGAAGGFRLARDAADVSMADILACVDDVGHVATCLLGARPCEPGQPCAVHDRWTEMEAMVLAPMAGTSIADLLGPAGEALHTIDISEVTCND